MTLPIIDGYITFFLNSIGGVIRRYGEPTDEASTKDSATNLYIYFTTNTIMNKPAVHFSNRKPSKSPDKSHPESDLIEVFRDGMTASTD